MFDNKSVVDNLIIGENVNSVSNTGAAAKIGLIEVLGNAEVYSMDRSRVQTQDSKRYATVLT